MRSALVRELVTNTTRRARGVALVGAFDLVESLRSKKALALLLLYVAGAVAATVVFASVLRELENSVASQLLVAGTRRPGTMTYAVMESRAMLDVLSGLLGDRALAHELVHVPPLALFYGWLALMFVPILVVLTSSEAIAAEVSSGSSRYALFRVERSVWCVGKLGGQAALMAVGIVLGALGAYITGAIVLAHFDYARTAWWMARLSGRAFVFGFAHLGLVLGLSQTTRSVGWARGLGLLALVLLAVAGALLSELEDSAPVVADTLEQILPRAHRLDLWRPDPWRRGAALAMLAALGTSYFALGHLRFRRRDA